MNAKIDQPNWWEIMKNSPKDPYILTSKVYPTNQQITGGGMWGRERIGFSINGNG